MKTDLSLGERMKTYYEDRNKNYLLRKTPVIIRLDGKAFHTFTKHMDKPFDQTLSFIMSKIALKLCEEIQGAKCAYQQSDEISLLLSDLDTIKTESWFDYNIQKICSVSASIATAEFNRLYLANTNFSTSDIIAGRIRKAYFDSRCFNIPIHEVENYFIWRQKDWIRNSIQMLAQSHFSHKQLHKKKTNDMHEMLYNKGVNWTDLEWKWKNGVFVYYYYDLRKWRYEDNCPIFSSESGRTIIRDLLKPKEEK